ncbi:MAG: helix-turn-helix domain-containing protein [Oscillospiraceae bacterium]|jgi:transcriptional regulator with XRE-family HTH domain|nr:helix-turn-helix domain-containing protein [Oscillospiraceae bacterium]
MDLRRIKDLREDADLFQWQIAKILNISERAYSSYETRDRQIPLDVLYNLADFYNTSVDYIMGRTDEKKPYPKGKRRENI